MADEELKRIGDVAWEAVHNHGAFRRDFRDDEYLEAVGAAVLAAVGTHTPTGDQREALRIAHLDARQAAYRREREDWFVDHEAEPEIATNAFFRGWDAAVAGGFRRSEVLEPSAEEWAVRIAAVREKAIAKGYTPEHDAKHGVRHLLRWAIDYSRRGRAEDSSGLVAAAIDLADVAYAELERLRHVADTMSAVSEALRTRYASDSQAAYFMREIDAALEALPERQGEPSDAQVAQWFHEAYERLAPSFGYETREASAKPWADVPEPNKSLMIAVTAEVRAALRAAGGVR